MVFDLEITETGNGGDLVYNGIDLVVVNNYQNMVYLAMFGGNSDGTDWWGNEIFFKETPENAFISETEYALKTTPLTSSGRIKIEEAIKRDLNFFRRLGEFTVQCQIVSDDRIDVLIRVKTTINERNISFKISQSTDGDFVINDFNDDFLL